MAGIGALSDVQSKEDIVLSTHVDAAPAATNQGASATQQDVTSEELLARILASLEADKAEEIVQIDLRGKSSIGDYMVVCSGRSSRQVTAIAEKLADRLKQDLGRLSKIEGKDGGDWVLIDTGDIIVHVFRPEVREFYQLEKMWLPTPGAAETRPS
ncbi:ribosome silencing factor [Rhodalgimonas zhirmunskyi]|uniref:Ribosomal silencing factor RsfS n=1 Tax=Rhodalgimonas zhirmunskyi TaxID=2964767 RepID=A0AAJ1UAL2_9RHOB|nr:ribosome silencing factor [Rhodoalgimonas zhirmunskyi]MDQ2095885.1 ribosome silencing factor [Rhodoalgimonas zhirmunskyi]